MDGADAKRELGILGKAAKSTGAGIKNALKWTAKISTKAAISALNGLKKAAQVTGSGMKAAFNFAKANPILLIISAIVALGVAFYELYKHNAKFRKFIDGIGSTISGFFKSAGKVIDKGIKSIQKAFKGVMNFFKKDWKEILLFIVNPFTGAFALLYKHNTKFRNGVNAVIKWFKTTLSKFGKWFSSSLNSFGKWYIKTWSKILEPIRDGFEAVFNFFGKIWNAWYKNFTHSMSAFGKWLSKTWKNIWNPIKDFFSDTWDDIKKTGQRAWNWISDKLDDFGSNVSKGWRGLWNGLKDFFSDIWDDIKGLAKDGINGVIGFINGGITGINKIISNFGGGKDTISTIKPVKFAHGTKGAPRGLAMVNDGFDSPTGQELIIDNQGRGTILEGRNQLVNFEGGETVVPASVTHSMLSGKFADGTNDWFGGLKNFFGDAAEDIGDMMKKATGKAAQFFNIAKNPFGYIKDKIFSPVTEGINNTKGSAVKALGNAFNSDGKGVKGNQNKWWKELWNMMKDTLSGGGKGGFGDDYLFKGHAKDDGADPWGYFFRECVSFVASRLKNEGVNPKLFTGLGNGSDWGSARVPHSSTPRVGDIAQYGAGSLYGNHVAVVTDVKGNKYREEGYNFGNPPNGKYYNSAQWHDASDASTFLRFPGAKGGKLSKNEEKKQSPLQKLIKKQVGGMFNWVENMVSSLMPSFTGPAGQAPKGDHKNWLSQAGIKGDYDKWNYIISHESGWNPHAKNPGSDAYGIGQALPPSKMAAFGSDYMSNPITQLKWMQSYVNERYGGINGAYDFWRSHNWYANGGWGGNKLGIFNEVPGEEEIAINPYRNISDQHIAEVIDKRSQLAPNSTTAKLQSYAHAIRSDMVQQPQTSNVSHSSYGSGNNSNDGFVSLSDLKGTTIKFVSELNGKVIAEETADMISMIQSKNNQINAYGTGQGGLLNG
ncbi:CHAP domain-containing protein [Weissella minor]|nr:CHAP domain-containing protein [Weissella minor]